MFFAGIPGGFLKSPVPPAPTAYAHGFSYQIPIRVGGSAITGSATLYNIPLWFDETLAVLKSVSNGGHVQSTSGYDIGFRAADGTSIPCEIEVYDPVAGRVAGYFRPSVFQPGTNIDLWLVYGKAGMVAPDGDAAATWSVAHGSWRMPSGLDSTAAGRHMTMSGVSATTINGMPAGLFGAASYGALADVSWFDNIDQFSTSFWADISSLPVSANAVRIGGAADGSGRHTIWIPAEYASAGRTWPWAVGAKIGSANPQSVGPTDSAAPGVQFIAATGRTGTWPRLDKDGSTLLVVNLGTVGTGVIDVQAGDTLRYGATFGTISESVRGKLGRLTIWREGLFYDWLRLFWRAQAEPRTVYGIGSEDAFAVADRSPILGPISIMAPAGTATTVPVLDYAADPDGNAMTVSIPSGGEPTLGTAGVSGSDILYTPPAGTPAGTRASMLARVTAGAKSSTAGIRIIVREPQGPVSAGTWLAIPNISGKTAVTCSGKAAVESAIGSVNPATHYIQVTGGWSGDLNVTRGGTTTHPLVIMSSASARENFSGRPLIQGRVFIKAQHVWLYQLNIKETSNNGAVMIQADYAYVTCCQIDASRGVCNEALAIPGHFYHVNFNRFTGKTTGSQTDTGEAHIRLELSQSGKQPDYGMIAWNIFTQDATLTTGGTNTHCIYTANGMKDPSGQRTQPFDVNLKNTVIQYNFFNTQRDRGIYLKHAVKEVSFNHVEANGAFHGISTRGCNAVDCLIRFNRVRNAKQCGVQSWRHTWIGNILENTDLAVYCGSDEPSNPKPLLAGHYAKLIGNKVPRTVIGEWRDDQPFKEKLHDVTIEAHQGSIVYMADANPETYNDFTFDSSGRGTGTRPYVRPETVTRSSTTAVDLSPSVPTLSSTTCGPIMAGSRGAVYGTTGGGTSPTPPTPPTGTAYDLVAANYAVHQPAAATNVEVEWLAGGGVRLKAGANATAGKLVRIWCTTAPPSGNCRFSFRFRQLDNNPAVDAEGIFALFVMRYLGTASSTPASPAAWSTSLYQGVSGQADVSDTIYRTRGKGYRPSFANANSDSSLDKKCRMRTYEGPGDTQIDPTSPSPQPAGFVPIAQGEDWDITFTRIGNGITGVFAKVGSSVSKTVVFSNGDFGSSGLGVGGYMGWCAARGREFTVMPIPGTPLVQAI